MASYLLSPVDRCQARSETQTKSGTITNPMTFTIDGHSSGVTEPENETEDGKLVREFSSDDQFLEVSPPTFKHCRTNRSRFLGSSSIGS